MCRQTRRPRKTGLCLLLKHSPASFETGNILWSAQKSPYLRGLFLYIVAVPRRRRVDFAQNVPRGTLFLQNCGPAKCSTWNISGCALPCPGEVFVWVAFFLRALNRAGKAFESKLPFPFSGRRGGVMSCARWPRHRPPPHAAFRTRCTRTVHRVRSDAHYAATAPRLSQLLADGLTNETGQCAALPCWPFDSDQGNTTRLKRSPVLPTQRASERTLFFVLKSVRDAACGGVGPGGAFSSKLPFPLPGRRWGPGSLGAGWPRHRPPPHAAFRTRCTPPVQRVRSEAHYAAAVPRLARPASGGGPGKTGESAALI